MKKTLRIIACIALVAVIGVGAFCAANFAGKDNTPNDKADAGLIITPGEVQGDMISLLTQGPHPNSKKGYTLTVVLNEDCPADMKAIDWSIAWKNPSSTWATGKVVTDYVTVTPTSDGALTAKVTKVLLFSEQIIVTAASRVRPELKATATVDCLKRYSETQNPLSSFEITLSDIVIKNNTNLSFVASVDDSKAVGTLSYTNCTDAGSIAIDTTEIKKIITKYGLSNEIQLNNYLKYSFYREEVDTIDIEEFLPCSDSVKETVKYKQAYNELLDLCQSGISVTFTPSLFYNGVDYNQGYEIFKTQTVKIDIGRLGKYDIVTNVSFSDNAIIF